MLKVSTEQIINLKQCVNTDIKILLWRKIAVLYAFLVWDKFCKIIFLQYILFIYLFFSLFPTISVCKVFSTVVLQ